MPVATFAEVMESRHGADGFAILADLAPVARPIREVRQKYSGVTDALVVVKPEGGFTDAERNAARASACTPVRINRPVMRIETACAAAAALVYKCS